MLRRRAALTDARHLPALNVFRRWRWVALHPLPSDSSFRGVSLSLPLVRGSLSLYPYLSLALSFSLAFSRRRRRSRSPNRINTKLYSKHRESAPAERAPRDACGRNESRNIGRTAGVATLLPRVCSRMDRPPASDSIAVHLSTIGLSALVSCRLPKNKDSFVYINRGSAVTTHQEPIFENTSS